MSISREDLDAGRVDLSPVADPEGGIVGPVHPGEILRHEFLEPMNVSAYRLAKDISVPLTRITTILDGGRAISADTALRLARYFGTSERFWLNLQAAYDLERAKDELAGRLDREVRPYAA